MLGFFFFFILLFFENQNEKQGYIDYEKGLKIVRESSDEEAMREIAYKSLPRLLSVAGETRTHVRGT